MEVKIIDMDHTGRGITKIDNKVCFVPNTLIGEIVDIDIVLDKKKYMIGHLNKIIKKSNERITEKCKYAPFCGGCNIMFSSYENQVNYKINKVKDILKRFANIDADITDFIKGDVFNYRNKLTFHVSEKIGLYKEKTTDIVEIDKCIISNKDINKIYSIIKNMDLNNVYEVIIKKSFNTDDIMVIFCLNDMKSSSFIKPLIPFVTSIIFKINNKYKTIYGSDYIIEKMGKYKFIISPDSFFQVNTIQAEKMYNKIKEYLGECDSLLDLYCGTGTIGLYVSDICNNVTGVEINKYAILDANKNKELNNVKNIEFICGDSKKVIKNINKTFDVIIVDPPRSGLDKSVVDDLIKIKPKKIIYVSCDAVTLARDLNLLKDKYILNSISLVDMFPNTSHIECVCVLRLR
ncbi:MAG: 23S rRNA (uracil(1939)-C(5))-methyltransferase RlmD [Clostridium sp.]|nr:23S rRNA (uracil(1939)-C(5))-methyltransferase RlmD [Clostridium sp.]MCM1444233.1 23S rRNA (uracil(1939)-C(5))-methyltransferase RlmD [Candidatus Amulumruptor caecigallinarius]